MTTNPLFLSPEESRGDLIQVDTALESMRDAGFDLTAAAGEPLDNSIEADATILRVQPVYSADKKSINELVFADNGTGIAPSILHHVLSMGYSTRYGQRQGLGRFGVGLKLAGLSLGERIDVYTKRAGDPQIYHSYFDLQEIRKSTQSYTFTSAVKEWPAVAAPLMKDPTTKDRDGNLADFVSGTVVIFGKIDRLSSGGRYGTSLPEKFQELRKFIARTYRKYLDTGRTIELDGKKVTLHDPLFLMDNPRIIEKCRPKDPRGTVIEEADLMVDGEKVHVAVTIVPQEFRPFSGAGGSYDSSGQDIRDFQINAENAGKISILRNGREIYYDIVPKLVEGGRTEKVNRYIGIEVSFPAELDEYFQVRHVKRGAEPVSKLREELRKWLERPVRKARKDIRDYWQHQDVKRRVEEGEHASSMSVAEAAEARLPKGQAGRAVSTEQQEELTQQTIDDLNLDPEEEGYAARIAQIRELITTKPVSLLDLSWPGKELLDIGHLNGKSVVKLNKRHAFFRDVYAPLKKVADEGADGLAPEDMLDLAGRARDAIDLLLMAFARAEGMHPDTEQFDGLKSYWGIFADAYLKERFKD
ncbi:ATP-binding protein [Streptomyces sp. NPDC057909]|uniref:ATP-binding protein n=1 Tax=Streptomyces sp. NPDC057909 TaxID=3346277 RepID=UPI0036E1C689